jgi:hypothetical protein
MTFRQEKVPPLYNGLSDVCLAKKQVESLAKKQVELEPHLWHKLYTEPHTEIFGYVACRVASKPLGCGGAE